MKYEYTYGLHVSVFDYVRHSNESKSRQTRYSGSGRNRSGFEIIAYIALAISYIGKFSRDGKRLGRQKCRWFLFFLLKSLAGGLESQLL